MTTAVEPSPLWRHPVFHRALFVSGIVVSAAYLAWGPMAQALGTLEFGLADLIPGSLISGGRWFVLPLVAFGAGVLASLSPCILPMVPLNVAYIGATQSRGWEAVGLSARFVLGAALALSVLGLVGDLAGWLLIEHRGPVLIGAGIAMVFLGLMAVELIELPGSGRILGGSLRLGPVAAGAAFSLVTTPCASPLLGVILAACAAQSVPGLGWLSMIAFALGYTWLVFVAGVFGGSLLDRLRGRSFEAPRALAGALMLVFGLGFSLAGLAWF